jgi:hypothetical protein
MEADVRRVARYLDAAAPFAARWPALQRTLANAPLAEQHARLVETALGALPFELAEEGA